jgi:2-polyprenyl-6-methoxyphenol hydroxylase-like FAD-dependent oxidoreductase
MMKVLISGASCAGLTLAYWLSRYGFSPTLVERAESIRTGGYKIDVRGSALGVLRRMGIFEEVAQAGTDMQGATVVDKTGKVIAQMSGNDFGLREGDDLEILRGELCQILRRHAQEVPIIFGDTIKAIKMEPDGVQVAFEKANPQSFDLVIGADGLHSNVRRLVFGEEPLFAKNLGLYLCVFSVPNTLGLDRWEMEYADLGKIVNIWSSRSCVDAKACFGFTAPDFAFVPGDFAAQAELLRRTYEGVQWQVPELLKAMDTTSDFYFDSATLICMDRWSKERVSLAGDAGYSASPMSGQGTSLALIGAYVLAGELYKARSDYKRAFSEYENKLRPFVKQNQLLAIKAAKLMNRQEQNRFVTWLHELVLKCAHGFWVSFFTERARRRIKRAANAITLEDYE